MKWFSPGTAPISNCTITSNLSITCYQPVPHCNHTMDLGVACKGYNQVAQIINNRTIENCSTQPPATYNQNCSCPTDSTGFIPTTDAPCTYNQSCSCNSTETIPTTTEAIHDDRNCSCPNDTISGQSVVTMMTVSPAQCSVGVSVLGVLVGLLTALLVTLLLTCTAVIRRYKLHNKQQ